MKTTKLLADLALLFAATFSAAAQTVTPTPTNGATFKGRVLDDATGKPIAGVPVDIIIDNLGDRAKGDAYVKTIQSDAEGRFEISNVVGSLKILREPGTGPVNYTSWPLRDVTVPERPWLRTNDYVTPGIKVNAAAGDSTVIIPDIRLQRGGWISGLVGLPERDLNWALGVTVVKEDNLSNDPVRFGIFCNTNGTFRTQPIPAGTYTLYVNKLSGNSHLPSSADLGSVSNITVIAGRDTTNVVIPAQMDVQTKGPSGR